MQPFPRLIPRSLCYAPNVAMAVKRVLLRGTTKVGGGGAEVVCECVHHADAYNEMAGSNPRDYNTIRDRLDDNVIIMSQAITITETCCVNVVGTFISEYDIPVTGFELERPLGTIVVDQEDVTIIRYWGLFHYSAWEVLPPGIYTYFLVNRSGDKANVYAAQMKIVAFECTGPPCACEYHEHAYGEWVGATPEAGVPTYYDTFADDATILSQAITITETCCVLAVGTIMASSGYAPADFDLERPLGVVVADQEDETVTDGLSLFHYSAWEILAPGIYTYFLVNRSGGTRDVLAAQLKIIAVTCV